MPAVAELKSFRVAPRLVAGASPEPAPPRPPFCLLKIAQPLMAGFRFGQPHQSRRDGRCLRTATTCVGPPTISFVPDGTFYFRRRHPSHKWLGYCRKPPAPDRAWEFPFSCGSRVSRLKPALKNNSK